MEPRRRICVVFQVGDCLFFSLQVRRLLLRRITAFLLRIVDYLFDGYFYRRRAQMFRDDHLLEYTMLRVGQSHNRELNVFSAAHVAGRFYFRCGNLFLLGADPTILSVLLIKALKGL